MRLNLSLLLLSACLLGGCGSSDSAKPTVPDNKKPGANTQEKPGTPAISGANEVTLQDVTLTDYQQILDKHKGKVILVDFWATYCSPCRKQFPHTVELAKTGAAKGLVVISFSCDDDDKKAKALQFLVDQKATLTNLRSKAGGDDSTFADWEIAEGKLPHLKIYDRTGKLRKVLDSAEEVDAEIEKLLAEK